MRTAERTHPLDRSARPVHLGPNALEQRPRLIPPPLRFQRPPKRPHQIPLPLSQTHCPRQEKRESETLLDGREAGVVTSKLPYQITRERLDDRVQRPHAPNALVDDDPHGEFPDPDRPGFTRALVVDEQDIELERGGSVE